MRLNSLCTRKSAISQPYPLTEDVSAMARHPIAYSVPLLGRHSADPYDLRALIAKLVGSAGSIPFIAYVGPLPLSFHMFHFLRATLHFPHSNYTTASTVSYYFYNFIL